MTDQTSDEPKVATSDEEILRKHAFCTTRECVVDGPFASYWRLAQECRRADLLKEGRTR